MKFIIFLTLLYIPTLLSQPHPQQRPTPPPPTPSWRNSSSNQHPPHPSDPNFMNHTHPFNPFHNFTNFTNSSQIPVDHRPLPPFYNNENFSVYGNFTEQELTQYENNFFNALQEILETYFNHTDEEIKEFKQNISEAFNQSMVPENEHDFHFIFQNLLENMSNNSNSYAQELDSFNAYELTDDEIKNIFIFLDQSTNSSYKFVEKEYLSEIQQQIDKEYPDLDYVFILEQNFTELADQLVEDNELDKEIAELLKMQVHNAIQQKYQQVWLQEEIKQLAELKQNPNATQEEIQEKQFIIGLQNQSIFRNKLINMLQEQFIFNLGENNLNNKIPKDKEISTILFNLKESLHRQDLHYDIQEIYEEIEEEIQYINTTEKQAEIRRQAIQALNNSGTQKQELKKLKQELISILDKEYEEIDKEYDEMDQEYYQNEKYEGNQTYQTFQNEEKIQEQKHESGNTFLIIVIIFLIIIVIAVIGYYLYIRQKKKGDSIRFTPQSETAGFFRQIDEGVKV